MLVDRASTTLTVNDQCELLNLSRSTFYYEKCSDNDFHLQVMREIDELYTIRPYYGTRRLSIELKNKGLLVGRDLVRSLMRKMGIAAIYPKPNLTKANPEHKIYPYLL
jgi:putative transposase